MRGKAIIIGAMGVVALATLTVNAQNSTTRTAPGRVTTLLAATTQLARERDRVSIAVKATSEPAATTDPTARPAQKTEAETKPVAPKVAITADCQAAITHLKDMHKAEVTEDAAERAATTGESTATAAADQTEDATEAQQWKAALTAARTACVPQLSTSCRSALSGLTSTLMALHTDELGESHAGTELDKTADFGAVRTAFSAIQTACADHD